MGGDMAQHITQQQLESYLWGAATLLRGTIDAGDYKQFIFPLLFYKRLCDVFDEETQTALTESDGDQQCALFPENHRFQIPPEAHWREVRQAARDVGRALQHALRAIETANPDKLYGIFGDAQWTNKDRLSDAMLRDLIEHFSALQLTVANLPEDELGQGYEYLIDIGFLRAVAHMLEPQDMAHLVEEFGLRLAGHYWTRLHRSGSTVGVCAPCGERAACWGCPCATLPGGRHRILPVR